MHQTTSRYFSLLFFLCCALNGYTQTEHYILRQGESYYEKGAYEKAEKAYRKAESGVGLYNAGNAAYQQGNLAAAATLFQEAAAQSTTYASRADALYNLGNALLRQNKLPEAIEAYERSLRLSANRPDAKKNLQIAKRLMQPPPPQPPPPKNPPPPPPSPIPRQQYLDKAQDKQEKEIPPASLPPETARRMLQQAILPEEQKNAQAYRERSPATRPSRVKKDW